jgi:hypothetical protein
MTDENSPETEAGAQGPQAPEQEHPAQDAHGGSMAPGLVDDTGHEVDDAAEDDANR